ncbi:MAG TPA: P-II family nitrogen regulator [Candidatus Pullilachnospira intestinigallinarum]|nr:P-II family nitrogen regulator [Candidatus Pullilachnospira intestinigallinarum]
MSTLYMMMTITKRSMQQRLKELYKRNGLEVTFGTLARGTASNEMLDFFGLEATEKLIRLAIVTDRMWRNIKADLEQQIRIDVPGTGIAFLVPLSSVGGKNVLQFLTDGQSFEKEEESVMKNTVYELIVVISNYGHMEEIMEAARAKGAGGGTVIHAKGTGLEKAEKFLGVSIVDEKEIAFIVAKTADKKGIMQSIMEHAGLGSAARAVVFSMPVTDTAGLRLQEVQ